MKKTYIAPKSTLVEIETANLLANSDVMLLDAGNGGDALGKKRTDDWDEEDF